ncbi:SPOR domain-containing protein [Thermovibrio ammonificans]
MGENNPLFEIPAYLIVKGEKLKVKKWGVKGLLLEAPLEGEVEADLLVPFDNYYEVVIPDLKLRCTKTEEGTYCEFTDLDKEQDWIVKFIVREYLWRRIVAIPSEFMNYTQDEAVREELLAYTKGAQFKKKLKFLLIGLGVVAAAVILFFSPKVINGLMKSGNTLSVTYTDTGKKSREQSPSQTEEAPAERESAGKTAKTVPEPPRSSVKEEPVSKEETVRKGGSEGTERKAEAKEAVQEEPTPIILPPKYKLSQGEKVAAGGRPENASVQGKEASQAGLQGASLSTERDYYCVQVASGTNLRALERKAEKLQKAGLPYVRVEKIGHLYTLRVGFEEHFKDAERLKRRVNRVVRGGFVRDCAYRPQRWVFPKESR